MKETASKVYRYIESHKLFAKTDKIIVALSGGADSVALLLLLLELGYDCEAAHCNFCLRADESDCDEAFVCNLCQELHVKLHVTHFDTQTVARERHISIEMAARELRYDWFETIRQQAGAAIVAVAHHIDDSVETVLLNLIRGTGIHGMQGIRPRNGRIVRPLLCIGRQEILDYLEQRKAAYVTDSTNLQDEYMRNKIRLKLIPLMQQINPAVKENIFRMTGHMEEAAIVYDRSIKAGQKRVRTNQGISIPALLQEPAPHALLFEILHPLGFNAAQTDDIFHSLQGQSGKQFTGQAGWQVIKDRDLLLIEQRQIPVKPRLEIEEQVYTTDFHIPKDRSTACFDTDKITQPLSLRLWQPGDTFVPFGMKGRKKVSDYLTDRKFSLPARQRQWVLCCGEEIIWLVNERSDNRFRIDEHTRTVLVVRTLTE